MALEPPRGTIRKLDLATFEGAPDTWATEAALATPAEGVPRLVVTELPVRWTVAGMSGGGRATQIVDTTTSITTRAVKLSRVDGGTVCSTLTASSGTIVNKAITEEDLSPGDVIAIAVTSVTTGVGSADWLWVIPTNGCELLRGVSI